MSLASGTFVLLVRLFFILAAQVPPAGLRKENGKLKINYTFANGETSDVEVREEIGNLILDSNGRKAIRTGRSGTIAIPWMRRNMKARIMRTAVLQRQNFFCSLKTSGSKRRSSSSRKYSGAGC